jgi:hypothetical protein
MYIEALGKEDNFFRRIFVCFSLLPLLSVQSREKKMLAE